MAEVNVALKKVEMNEGFDLPEAVALDATDGAYISFRGQDAKTVILLTGTGEAVVKAGDGLQAINDLAVTVGANGTALELESGAYKITSGAHKGTVHITGPATVKVQAFELI